MPDTDPQESEKTPYKPGFIKDLFDRRFPQIILIYFGACWTILEFTSWIVEHYVFSPHLIDLSFVTLISLVPTVGMLAFFHGRPGRDKWTKTEKIGIPINILFTIILILTIFGGKELGSATTEVAVQDEAGQTHKRKIPKGQMTKRLAIFFFENETGDTNLDWLQYAIMAGCHVDLDQDPFFSVYSAYDNDIYQRIVQAGFSEGMIIPLTLEKKVAQEIEREYFLEGSIKLQHDTLVVSTYLYETTHGRLISEHTLKEPNIFNIIDQISLQTRKDLGIPDWHIESLEDLPITELFTRSHDAFREYIRGSNLINLKNDLEGSLAHFYRAVESDPSFALAWWALYTANINLGRTVAAIKALDATMQNIYKLPENLQFLVKEEYYLVTEEPEKRLAVLNMWVNLYPDDIRGHFRLAGAYFKRNQIDQAIEEYNKILAIDPSRVYYFSYIGSAYLQKGFFKEAIKYLEQYQKHFPKDYRPFLAFGNLYYTMGQYDNAQQNYTNALMLQPTEISIMTLLASVNLQQGKYEEALTNLKNADSMAKTAVDRNLIYEAHQEYYRTRGQINKALSYRNKKFEEQNKYLRPLEVITNRLKDQSYDLYCYNGTVSFGLNELNTYRRQLSRPWSRIVWLGYLQIYLEQQDTAKAQEAIEEVKTAIRIFGEESNLNVVHRAQGKISEFQENYLNAILEYQQASQYNPTDVTILTDIARCYRKINESQKAQKLLATTLKVLPMNPYAHLELAQICINTGDLQSAQEHLAVALRVWQDADSGFTPANTAKKLLQALQPRV
jgi:tetratricopeptide (TPR) repeat protein/TolB-like protein